MPADNRVTAQEVVHAVAAAAGRQPGTLLLKNARLVNPITREIQETAVLVAGRLVAGVGPEYAAATAAEVVDLEGRWLVPGLIDGHVHLESSLVAPGEYARAVVPRGVTGVVCDPHEIANVAGIEGVQWFLAATQGLPLSVWAGVPSCVPSTPLETTGAYLDLKAMAELMRHPQVVGVAEIMSFPEVIAANPDTLSKALLAEEAGKAADGHAPQVMGRDLQAYLCAGIRSDHECVTAEEGIARMRAGCFVLVREGSVTRNLAALAPLLRDPLADCAGFCTDDRLPHDLLTEGGVDFLVRKAIALGVEPALAIRCATWNTARYFRLTRRGAVAPGYFADLVVLDNLEHFQPHAVYKEGKQVAADGRLLVELPPVPAAHPAVRDTVRIPPLDAAALRLPVASGPLRCIALVPDQILTREVHVEGPVPDPERDIAKLICVERHGKGGGVGVGLVTGLGLRRGAIATTVAHDHHNLIAAGVDDADLLAACRHLAATGGGFAAAVGGQVVASLPLPIAGLLTDRPLAEVRDALDRLEAAVRELGVPIPSPFMALSFLGLAVIPELRLTDRGLVDARTARLLPVAAHTG